ncbi:MAG TPA: nucleotidyltransferase [Armatimonadota bacterium]
MEVTAVDFKTLHEACSVLDARGIPYVIGGGTAVVIYGRDRRTKDFDIFMNRDVLRVTMDILSNAGFTTADTEKRWLYKVWRDELTIDLIVETRGGDRIDEEVMARSRMIDHFGQDFRIMGPEDTLYRKILTQLPGRPDWYDALSIIERQDGQLDWTYFLSRAQRYPRRVLGFLLFAQTELHVPATPRAVGDNVLFQGDTPGPIPQWVVFSLVRAIWLGGVQPLRSTRQLEDWSKAA